MIITTSGEKVVLQRTVLSEKGQSLNDIVNTTDLFQLSFLAEYTHDTYSQS